MAPEDRNRLRESFWERNIGVEFFNTLEMAKAHILSMIPAGCAVGIGHSGTLEKMHLTQALLGRGNVVFDKELAADREASKALKKKAMLADWYLTGSNAVSVDGRIVNVDHSGNRVAAISFGPDRVVIVVGKNKIVDTVDEAVKRVKNIACPLNAKRAGFHPPCVALNRCVDCTSKERVCNVLSIVEGQVDSNRIQLLVVEEECGF